MNFKLLAILALSFCLFSCFGTPHRPRFNPPQGLNGKEILLVPFRESKEKLWHGESRRGHLVAEAFKGWAETNADSYFAAGEGVHHVLNEVLDWRKDRISGGDWQALAGGLGVRYVVAGDLRSVSLRSRGMIGLYDPSAEAYYEVIDVQRGRVVYDESPKISLASGEEPRVSFTARLDRTDVAVERRLLTKLGEQIAKDLYGYTGD